MDLKGKVVIISGSSQGIGKATAKAFLKEGCKVVINGRKPESLKKAEEELKENGTVLAIQADITDEHQAQSVIDETVKTFGRIDILVNNAGFSMRGKVEDLDPSVFRHSFNTNVLGVTNLTIPAMPHIKGSRGSIVFVSSLAGIRGLPGLSAYCSSKLALRAIAESIRIEEAKSGIHVGLIHVSQAEVDHNKQAMDASGNMVQLESRSHLNVTPLDTVAKAIIRNIKKRRFITTMSLLGKLNGLMQAVAPGLLEKILIKNVDKILKKTV